TDSVGPSIELPEYQDMNDESISTSPATQATRWPDDQIPPEGRGCSIGGRGAGVPGRSASVSGSSKSKSSGDSTASDPEDPGDLAPDRHRDDGAGDQQEAEERPEAGARHPCLPAVLDPRVPLRPVEPVGAVDRVRIDGGSVAQGGVGPEPTPLGPLLLHGLGHGPDSRSTAGCGP